MTGLFYYVILTWVIQAVLFIIQTIKNSVKVDLTFESIVAVNIVFVLAPILLPLALISQLYLVIIAYDKEEK